VHGGVREAARERERESARRERGRREVWERKRESEERKRKSVDSRVLGFNGGVTRLG